MVVDCGGKSCNTILKNRSFYVYHLKDKQLNNHVSKLTEIQKEKKMLKMITTIVIEAPKVSMHHWDEFFRT